MNRLVSMSEKELSRLGVMVRLCEGRLGQAEAARELGITVRQVRRLLAAYREGGPAGLLSKRRGQPSNHQLDPALVKEVLTRLYGTYVDFGPTLAHEKLTEEHGLRISVESVRQLMITEGLWRPRRAKHPRIHPLRERRACRGELVQVDGCWYRWLEGRAPACTLLVFVDDATGQLVGLHLAARETMFSYARAMRAYLSQHGRPVALYTDKHGVFHVNAKAPTTTPALTQFGRAMQDLDVQILCANTPQAKGRVERVHQTLQDRLVKELRLRGIADIDSANRYLPEFCDDYNARFGVAPRSDLDAHRPLRAADDLSRILSWQETRVLSKSLTLQYDHRIYQIDTSRPAYALRGATVTICQGEEGGVLSILYRGVALEHTIIERQPRQSEVVSSKDLTQALPDPAPLPHPTPSPLHPWRRMGQFASHHPQPQRTSLRGAKEDISTLG
jgi:transposase